MRPSNRTVIGVLALSVVGISFARLHERQLLAALEDDMIHQAELVRGLVPVSDTTLILAARETRARIRVLSTPSVPASRRFGVHKTSSGSSAAKRSRGRSASVSSAKMATPSSAASIGSSPKTAAKSSSTTRAAHPTRTACSAIANRYSVTAAPFSRSRAVPAPVCSGTSTPAPTGSSRWSK